MSERNNKREVTPKELILKIREWLQYLKSKWLILLIISAIGGIGGFFYSKIKKNIYTATTTFVLESTEQASGIGQYAGMAALVGIDLGGKGEGIFQGDNLMELYKSQRMIKEALLKSSEKDSSKLLIIPYLKLKNSDEDKISIFYNKGKINDKLLRIRDSILNDAVEDINKNILKVEKLDKKLSIFKVDVMSQDENFSKVFNETLVQVVNDFYINTKTKKSLDNVKILQLKTDSVRALMNGNISESAYAIDATPNLNPTRQAQRLVPTQRSQFSAETNKAILAQLVQNLEMSKMALMKETPLIQVVDEPVFPLKKTTLGRTKGIILGAIVSFIFTALCLICVRIFNKIML
ncbi:Wzz/FepE/Etk N-terminal domain-containing protein [Sphingobacterium multivorum]|uniref:Wzz/FepE/Etk N-terminal domain-containing protein n=1 Tax=Sphingobacterium multivorum TaxID=28454 RepID=UPI0028A7D91A|nr:Wzz/FepE/Etk N-terminal domain-containing protein [Sphingobacterium multivorum]